MKRIAVALVLVVFLLTGCAKTTSAQGTIKSSVSSVPVAATPTPVKTFDGSGVKWQATPRSTCFAYVGYDKEFQKLAVIFRSNETRVYIYSDFTQSDMNNFLAADSLGEYYNENIKGFYDCERIDEGAAFFIKGK